MVPHQCSENETVPQIAVTVRMCWVMKRPGPHVDLGIAALKRPRYSDVYQHAFQSRYSIQSYIHATVARFRHSPLQWIRVPHYISTMLCTQSLAEKERTPPETLRWALRLVRFLERRAARILTQQALHFIYRPQGPWFRRTTVSWGEELGWLRQG